ncbi:MAG TPA: AAA family ATPase, partial [Deltaproteobacteria bacterium]|nr:AAA family ATPase [Deltaproteobacteria bacterium]
RKPMVLRGARQVGKTWLVRDLAKRHDLQLIEINLERFPTLADLFSENRPQEILKNIEAEFSVPVKRESSLLFIDEIQAVPELFTKLRWFREDMPDLPVIAAGSLLDFALSKYQYSMPVGRITYFYLEPISFFEFVRASGHDALYQKLSSFSVASGMPQSLHEKCLKLYQTYCLTGGMPEVVQEWITTEDIDACIKIQHDLLATYRDDFHKYGGEMEAGVLSKIMLSAARQLGNKFVYSRVDPASKTGPIKKAFDLLCQAKVCTKVSHSAGNGLPLGAESNEKFFKALMVDIGLISIQLGISSTRRQEAANLILSNKGGLAEQFVGQQLRALKTPLSEAALFYWQKTGGRQGEIDFLLQHGDQVVPLEVKSGPAGSMKSLHQFMAEKHLDLAVRCNFNLPTMENIQLKTTLGQAVSYRLLSIPVYLTQCLDRLMEEAKNAPVDNI